MEISIALVILGLLLRATLVPLGTLRDSARERAARDQIDTVRGALLAAAATHRALPCPTAVARTGGDVASAGGGAGASASGDCARFRGGVPAAALALAGAVDASGALLDPWGRPLLYAVSDADAEGAGTPGSPDWTVPGEAGRVGVDALRGTLALCRVAVRGACPRSQIRAQDLAFVVVSHGEDPSARDLQAGNAGAFARGNPVATLAPRSAVDGHRFDDLLAWGSRAEIVLWWLRAGVLH